MTMPEGIPTKDSTRAGQRRWHPNPARVVAACDDADERDRDRDGTGVFTGLIPSCLLAPRVRP